MSRLHDTENRRHHGVAIVIGGGRLSSPLLKCRRMRAGLGDLHLSFAAIGMAYSVIATAGIYHDRRRCTSALPLVSIALRVDYMQFHADVEMNLVTAKYK